MLSPHAKQVVEIGLSERSGPARQQNDELDAYDLADRHRRDALPRAVFKDAGQLTSLRQLAGGTKPNLAKVTLARKIAATALAMWKTKEAYDPKKETSTAS